ncbi:kinase-like domain-containing protein [Annulohypoxylon moriforme]|nr:kinase-like domain-containing protein [Annulohypoxylon moriforme]
MSQQLPVLYAIRARFTPDEDRFQRAKFASNRMREIFSTWNHVKYERVLGHGGMGMVQLWSIFNEQHTQIERNVAIKFPIVENESNKISLRSEIDWGSKLFANLMHFVQLVDIEGTPPEGAMMRMTNSLISDPPILVMEALTKCNLLELISWHNESRDDTEEKMNNETLLHRSDPRNAAAWDRQKFAYIPNRVLWKFFLCLVRGVIGMAWSPNDYPGGPVPAPNGPILEELPPLDATGRPPPESRIIHFDLDILNVMVGDVDFAEHSLAPSLKVADYGLTLRWDETASNNRKRRYIGRGKTHYQAPEQRRPHRATDPRYHIGIELNIWAIGMIMFDLLTLSHPSPIANWHGQNRWLPVPGTLGGMDLIRTWGWALLDPPPGVAAPAPTEFIAAYDVNLRYLIALCMADETSRRPRIEDLYNAVVGGMNEADARVYFYPNPENHELNGIHYHPLRPSPVESDNIINRWYYDYFINPPEREDIYAGRWDE